MRKLMTSFIYNIRGNVIYRKSYQCTHILRCRSIRSLVYNGTEGTDQGLSNSAKNEKTSESR